MKFSWSSLYLFLIGAFLFSIGLLETTGILDFHRLHAILGNNRFFNISGIFILFGGLISSTAISFPFELITGAFKQLIYFFSSAKPNKSKVITEITSWVIPYNQDPNEFINSLSNSKQYSRSLSRFILELFISKENEEELDKLTYLIIKSETNKYRNYSKVFKTLGITAPAIGMIGTLLGLVYMLGALDDPTKIGPGLALGLIVTLYGVLLSNLLFLPISRKLSEIESAEKEQLYFYSIGIQLIRNKKSEKYIREYLELISSN